jgi:hypothetical protein
LTEAANFMTMIWQWAEVARKTTMAKIPRTITFSPDWYVGGSVLVPGRSSSIVEITRFQLQKFTVSIKELAEWFGLEIARIVVDECLTPRRN